MSEPATRLRVRVQPRAGANEIAGVRNGVLVVRVTAPPEGGRANDAVRKVIAAGCGSAPAAWSSSKGHRRARKPC